MVKADPGQIEQVLVNLAVNARDAMPNGGTLTIATTHATLRAREAQQIDVAPGDYVVLSVRDTGVGMTEDVKQHLFEPFFTTKGPGKGTGLGLPTCYGIVKQHGGHIEVASAPQQGATFTIYLPCATPHAPAAAQPAAIESSLLLRGAETVLLAEDEPAVRAMASRILRAYGYHVLEAADGEAALDLAQTYGQAPINLLLTDVVMPRMNGRLLAEQLLRLYPAIKVLYTSGYTDDASVHFGWQELGIDFIQKPFSPMALARKVRNVLDS
jgi:CheY-like chemotaxis protein